MAYDLLARYAGPVAFPAPALMPGADRPMVVEIRLSGIVSHEDQLDGSVLAMDRDDTPHIVPAGYASCEVRPFG